MADALPSIVVTGISGNLGQRLLPMLAGFHVVGVDFRPPPGEAIPVQFVKMDLGQEASCQQLLQLLRDVRPTAVVHLAFVMDAVRTGVLDRDRMWQTNVAGTARVMEAIAEANREWPMVEKFVFMSSVSAYGPGLSKPATEETPLAAHTYLYGTDKMEADRVVQQRGTASARMQRVHPASAYFCRGQRGQLLHGGVSRDSRRERASGRRGCGSKASGCPACCRRENSICRTGLQFVHVDDVARLIAHILLKTEPEAQRLTILNVAGRGEPMTYEQCVRVANAKLVRVPTVGLFKLVLEFLWKMKISTIPPDVAPYMTSEMVMDTSRLAAFLGDEYRNVVRYPVAEAFGECFKR